MAVAGAVLLAGLALAAVVWAQTSPNYDLSWHVVAGGGSRTASSGHVVQSTVGQFAIGPGTSTHTVGAGYWYGMLRITAPGYDVYLPIVLRND
jgi:hypothetical protein